MAETLTELLEGEHRRIDELFAEVSSPTEDRAFRLSELIRDLSAHVSIEHSIVFPAVKRRGIGGPAVPRRLRRDYRDLQRLLVRIERRKPNSPDQPVLLRHLAEIFDRHRDLCTTVVHPGLAETLPASEQEELRAKVVSAQGVIVSHPHPHLLSYGPLSRMTTRIAGSYDQLRDTASGRRRNLGEQRPPGSR